MVLKLDEIRLNIEVFGYFVQNFFLTLSTSFRIFINVFIICLRQVFMEVLK